MGTINGLIFYAKIFRVNHAFFITTPTTFALKVSQNVLSVFIAWLNLDLGIEICFFHGMEACMQGVNKSSRVNGTIENTVTAKAMLLCDVNCYRKKKGKYTQLHIYIFLTMNFELIV